MGDYAAWVNDTTRPASTRAANPRIVFDYQTCDSTGCGSSNGAGWPNYTIDANPAQNRASPWLSYVLGTGAEFYWDMVAAYNPSPTVGAGDPWQSPRLLGAYGEGTLFYPGIPSTTGRTWPAPCGASGFAAHTPSIGGTHDIAIPSIRLKLIRDGIEDYEYLKLFHAVGGDAVSQALAVYPKAYATDVDPARLIAARQTMAATIEPAPPPPPPAAAAFEVVLPHTDPVTGASSPITLSF
jgi:hypothetical protein